MGGQTDDPWFRVGRFDVSTTMAVVVAGVVSMLAWVAYPPLSSLLAYSPWTLADGEVWRPFTWPLANELGLFSVLNLFFFWVFGTELERQVGGRRFAKLLAGIWAAMTASATLVGLAFSSGGAIAGLGMVQFLILLLWIAEYPNRPFFFGIPAWVVGAVLLALNLLGSVANRDAVGLFAMLLSLALVAVLARRMGLLRELGWIPGASKPGAKARPTRQQKQAAKVAEQRVNDQARLDQLLDKISAGGGVDALSASERQELMRLRNRRQG